MSLTIHSKTRAQLNEFKEVIERQLTINGIVILPPMDVRESLQLISDAGIGVQSTILDPWYNKGKGEILEKEIYNSFVRELLLKSSVSTNHIFLWGFPEIIARFVDDFPNDFELKAWLTWYYKNAPSRNRGWRPSQNACLHFSRENQDLHPENFMNGKQLELRDNGKLTYIPGPTTVIEEPLLVGFVGKDEQTGHPSQKPVSVFKKIILMTTVEDDIVFDPMSGSGTTGEACFIEKRKAILCDASEEYTQLIENRLNVARIELPDSLLLREA